MEGLTLSSTTPRATAQTGSGRSGAAPSGARKAYAALIGLSALFVLFQYFTSGEFITDGIEKDTRELWTNIHGFGAYPVMVLALAATVVAFTRLRAVRGLAVGTAVYFIATVVQWLLGHAISTLGIDALTPPPRRRRRGRVRPGHLALGPLRAPPPSRLRTGSAGTKSGSQAPAPQCADGRRIGRSWRSLMAPHR